MVAHDIIDLVMSNWWRKDFPAINNQPEIIFFDNAATTQKPFSVIRRMNELWEKGVTAIGRSSGALARAQSDLYEQAQKQVAQFMGARANELIIVKSSTEGLNFLAQNFCQILKKDEKILLSQANHHSNLAPWFKLKKDQTLWLPFLPTGKVDSKTLKKLLLTEKIKIVSLTAVSNVFGVTEEIEKIANMIEKVGQEQKRKIYLIVDAAAAVTEQEICWRKSKADALVVSGHKMFAPHIAGVLVKNELLSKKIIQPLFYGGGMLQSLSLDKEMQLSDNWQQQYRAGVSDLVSLVGWAQACQYFAEKGQKESLTYLKNLTDELIAVLIKIPEIKILGEKTKGHLVSFTYQGFNSVDIMSYLASRRLLAREGYHCCQPLHEALGLKGSLRFSLSPYNTSQEIDVVRQILEQIPKVLWSAEK